MITKETYTRERWFWTLAESEIVPDITPAGKDAWDNIKSYKGLMESLGAREIHTSKKIVSISPDRKKKVVYIRH